MKNILKGVVASKGSVKGKIQIVKNENDNFTEGNILVTEMTNPLMTPLILKAKALVTDYGGLLCHTAIVARELGIPCIVGTEKATKLLKDGDTIIFDGESGIIYKDA